jgi:hypothetical protein
MQPENQLDSVVRRQGQFQRPVNEAGDAVQKQNTCAEATPLFDLEETADIVLPIDHPIFRRKF